MQDHELERLLRAAADADAVPVLPDGFADRLRRLDRGRRNRRRVVVVGSLAALGLAAVAGTWCAFGWRPETARLPSGDRGPTATNGKLEVTAPGSDSPGTDVAHAPSPQDDGSPAEALASADEILRLQDELSRLRREAARRGLEREMAALRRELRRPDPRDLVRAAEAKTALLLVHRAEAYEKRDRAADARREYERVVRLFPDTPWAETARIRLGGQTSN